MLGCFAFLIVRLNPSICLWVFIIHSTCTYHTYNIENSRGNIRLAKFLNVQKHLEFISTLEYIVVGELVACGNQDGTQVLIPTPDRQILYRRVTLPVPQLNAH